MPQRERARRRTARPLMTVVHNPARRTQWKPISWTEQRITPQPGILTRQRIPLHTEGRHDIRTERMQRDVDDSSTYQQMELTVTVCKTDRNKIFNAQESQRSAMLGTEAAGGWTAGGLVAVLQDDREVAEWGEPGRCCAPRHSRLKRADQSGRFSPRGLGQRPRVVVTSSDDLGAEEQLGHQSGTTAQIGPIFPCTRSANTDRACAGIAAGRPPSGKWVITGESFWPRVS